MRHILAVDMGGTRSRFGYFVLDAEGLVLRQAVECRTADLKDTASVMRKAEETGLDPAHAHALMWAVAGRNTHPLCASLTNASLCLDFRTMGTAAWRSRVRIINDFAAQAWACLSLPGRQALRVLPSAQGNPADASLRESRQVKAVVGAGTGLGEACLIPCNQAWFVLPSEAGHVDFSFCGQEEEACAAFARHMLGRERLRAEDMISGRGLALLHHFVTGRACSPQEAAAALPENGGDQPRLQDLFARFLGRVCRHWALSTLCAGGLYVSGGVAAANPGLVRCAAFAEELYAGPSHVEAFLRQLPVFLMSHPLSGLWGAARAAEEMLTSACLGSLE